MATEPTDQEFFDKPTPASLKKISLVERYFSKWSSVMMRNQVTWQLKGRTRFAYVDLYCGPGTYSDGTPSTPIRILQAALKIDKPAESLFFAKYFFAHFNDVRADRIAELESSISQRVAAGEFRADQLRTSSVELGPQLDEIYGDLARVPTLSFIDPFGIKGLSQSLIRRLISGRGCDCILFFNYMKFNKYISAEHYKPHINGFFGTPLANELRSQFSEPRISAAKREAAMKDAVLRSLSEVGALPVQPFKFWDEDGARTSHFLFMATKSDLAEKFWKQSMKAEDQASQQGVPLFEFSPRPDLSRSDEIQTTLGFGDGLLDRLEVRIVEEFRDIGTVKAKEIVRRLTRGTRYLEKNVKDALLNLEKQNKADIVRAHNRRTGTQIGDDALITILKS